MRVLQDICVCIVEWPCIVHKGALERWKIACCTRYLVKKIDFHNPQAMYLLDG